MRGSEAAVAHLSGFCYRSDLRTAERGINKWVPATIPTVSDYTSSRRHLKHHPLRARLRDSRNSCELVRSGL